MAKTRSFVNCNASAVNASTTRIPPSVFFWLVLDAAAVERGPPNNPNTAGSCQSS